MPKNILSRSYANYSGNVMQAISWVVGSVEAFLLIFSSTSSIFWVQVVSFFCAVALMGVYLGIYIYWMLHDPNRLQSEGYNLEVMNVLSESADAKLSIESKKSTIKVSERH
jgi:hypothetical protein